MPNGVSENFEETLLEIANQTNAAKDDPVAGLAFMPILHTIMPVWMQMMAAEKVYGAMPVSLTNLGNIKCETLALGVLIPTVGVFGGPLKKKGGMQISIMSFDGECVLSCYGQYTAEDAAHIQKTLNKFITAKLENRYDPYGWYRLFSFCRSLYLGTNITGK